MKTILSYFQKRFRLEPMIFIAILLIPFTGFSFTLFFLPSLSSFFPSEIFSISTPLILIIQLLIIFGVLFFARHLLKRHRQLLLIAEKENEIFLNELIVSQPAAIYRIVKKASSGASPEGIPQIEYDYLSAQHEKITGVCAKELSRNPFMIVNSVHPDDKNGFVLEFNSAVNQKRAFKWEGRYMVKGQVKWLRFESNPTIKENGDMYWTGVIMDITRQKEMENQMTQHLHFEKLISEISTDFVNLKTPNFDNILTRSLGKIGKFCQIDRAYFFIWDKKSDIITNTHEWCQEGIEAQIQNLAEIPCADIPAWMSELKNFKPIVCNDVSKLPDGWKVEKQMLDEQDVKSVAVVPVMTKEKFIGFLGFDSVDKYRNWQKFEIQLLKVFADLLFNAIERKENEQELLESQQMLRTVLDNIPVLVFWKDRDLKFLGCNTAFAQDAGYNTPEEIIGMDDYQMCWKIYADSYRKIDQEIIDSGVPILEFEEPHSDIEGNIRVKVTSKIPLRNSQGEIIGVLGTSTDVTEQKRAEEALRASEKKYRILTENAFDGIYLMGLKSFEYVNQRFCEITGYSYDELVNKEFDISSMISQEYRDLFFERKEARLNKNEVPRTYETSIITKTGKTIEVEISTTPLGAGDDIQVLGILREITERKNNEKLLREVAIAKQSVQFKQNFLANMSHEIRTPLTGVLGMIELLGQTKLDKQQLDFINTLKLSTENLREIINQILDYSKIEAGQIKLRRDIFHKKSILENAKKLFESICFKDITLETYIDPQIPDYIKADEQRLSQVIYNLLSNAVKFTFEGKIILSANVKKWIDELNILIEVRVTDTGIGIRDEFIPMVFTPFEQFDHKQALYREGTGLGLTISKELVELMGGEINLETHEGQGTTFFFTFIAALAEKNQVNEKKAVMAKSSRRLKILLAEDKIVNQKVISMMLKSQGHEVVIANNGKEALEKYKPRAFDLILMDIQMPVMDGLTATQTLKSQHKDLPPVVGISANAFEGDREKYMSMGLDEYITKPVKSADFSELIKKIL
jgi:PAS domain S-box-containing protein